MTFYKQHRFWFLTALALLIFMFAFSCAEKEKGGDDDDGGADDDDDDDTPGQGVGSYNVYLNMVPVPIGANTTIATRTVYDANGDSFSVDSILVSDVIDAIEPFAPDAASFIYEFISRLDATIGPENAPGYTDLASAAFYENDTDELCIGWTAAGHESQSLCDMENGALITHPVDGAFDVKPISYINERTGDQPDHLGEELATKGIVTVGTGVLVSGSYVKTFIQQDAAGVKIFADMAATEEDQGYDGTLFSDIYTFEGDEVFVLGRITLHSGMIEYVPKSAYHIAVLSIGNDLVAPQEVTIGDIDDDPFDYAGALVRLNDLEMVDVNPDDATTGWPEYGTKSKDIRVRHTTGGLKVGLPIYEGTGIPGSFEPEDGFDAIGVLNVDEGAYLVFPRKIEDINPTDQHLSGAVRVTIFGEDISEAVNLSGLNAGLSKVAEDGEPIPVVSIASIVAAAGVTRNPKRLEYKPMAYDGRKPFEPSIFDEIKSGVLYQGTQGGDDEPDPFLISYFWEGMNLSDIYYLNGVTDVQAFREVEPPEQGDAVHGEGVTLIINGVKYAINFDTLPTTDYQGDEAIAFSSLISDPVITLYSMDGSFTTDQVKILYDYRLVSYDESEETIITFDDLADGYLVMADPPYTVFPSIGQSAKIEDLYTIDMMRMIRVDFGDDSDPETVYLRDCDTQPADVGEGVMEDVVFFSEVLTQAGVDTSTGMYRYDFYLHSSDDFTSYWTYGHNHLENMFFRPYENKGYTTDPDLGSYGGRVSTKAVMEIEMDELPENVPSIPVIVGDETMWGSDAESCYGCHFKNELVQIPIDCYSCHGDPGKRRWAR